MVLLLQEEGCEMLILRRKWKDKRRVGCCELTEDNTQVESMHDSSHHWQRSCHQLSQGDLLVECIYPPALTPSLALRIVSKWLAPHPSDKHHQILQRRRLHNDGHHSKAPHLF